MTLNDIIHLLEGKDELPEGVELPAASMVIPSAEGEIVRIKGVAEATAEDLAEFGDDDE